jgi:spore maturation protein CgeB
MQTVTKGATSVKVLVIDTYYWPLLVDHKLDRALESPAAKQAAWNRVDSLSFGTGVVYVKNLIASGHKSHLLVANSPALQLPTSGRRRIFEKMSQLVFRYPAIVARVGFLGDFIVNRSKFLRVLKVEIESFAPDALLVLDINLFSHSVLSKLAPSTVIRIGEIASPLPPKRFIRGYDLIFSAHPGLVKEIESIGVKASLNPLGVDANSFSKQPSMDRDIDAVFVGSLGRLQKNTGPLLAEVKKLVPSLQIYGNISKSALKKFGLVENYMGPAWGSKMHEILSRAKLSVNRHGEIAGPYAVNMRMYESTAAGAMLLTEDKTNLKDLFTPGTEVVTYRNNREAAEKARFYLDHLEELAKIANAGQNRTLAHHTYQQRVARMTEEMAKLVNEKRA